MLSIHKKQLQRFLDPLGIQLKYDSDYWKLFTNTNTWVGIAFSLNDNFVNIVNIGWRNYTDLLHDIFDVGNWLVGNLDDSWKTIARNPYLGAKSIEELQIRKDLLGQIA